MNHLSRKSKFALSTNVDTDNWEKCLYLALSLKIRLPIFVKCEKHDLLVSAMKNHRNFTNPYCGHFTKISSSYHIIRHKKGGLICSDRLYADKPAQQNSTSVSAQIKSTRQSMQTVIYYHCPVHSYHPLKTVSNHRSLSYGTVQWLHKSIELYACLIPFYEIRCTKFGFLASECKILL